MPFYREEYDTIAQRIYEEALPGYNIVGIDCDNNGNNIISLSGAIHCITHSVGVNDPLLISYKKFRNFKEERRKKKEENKEVGDAITIRKLLEVWGLQITDYKN